MAAFLIAELSRDDKVFSEFSLVLLRELCDFLFLKLAEAFHHLDRRDYLVNTDALVRRDQGEINSSLKV